MPLASGYESTEGFFCSSTTIPLPRDFSADRTPFGSKTRHSRYAGHGIPVNPPQPVGIIKQLSLLLRWLARSRVAPTHAGLAALLPSGLHHPGPLEHSLPRGPIPLVLHHALEPHL
jgi:hypothetical protein